MISYLLSGWRVYVPDENGHPLYRGRVYFYDASTSEPSAVYQEKEKVTSLGTYVDVDNHGFLPPIWLDSSHLYKCVVKQLIQQDPETWQTLWEIDDVGNPFITSDTDDGSSTIMVNDIALLRAIDVASDERPDYVSVAGWFNPGDTGSPMVFRWREGEVHNEDGHWVKPSSSASLGTWEQILDDEIDPRKFGAIPDTGDAVDSALVNCMRYACEPHVQDVSEPTVYKPRTVKFVRSGNYKLNGNFDFADYSMIPAFGSTPVPVVIGDGVYFDGTAEFGQGVRIESSQAIGNNFIIKDKETYLRTSWYGNKLNIVASSPRVIVIDDDIGIDTLPLTGRVIISLLDTVPSNLMLTDCVVMDAKNGALSAKMYASLLQIGEYLITHGFDSGFSYMKLFGNNNVEIFNMTSNDPTFKEKLNLEKGFRIDANNYFEYDSLSSRWRLVADTVSSLNNIGNFKGDVMPQNGRSVVQIDLVNSDASQTLYKTETLNLADGALGWIIVVYGTQGGYMTGHIYNLLNQKSIDINIYGASGANLHLPIDTANIMIPVMRIGTSFAIGLPREIRTRRNSSDANQGCLITIGVSSI